VVDVRVTDHIADVPGPDWDSLVGDEGFYLSYDWLRYVETEPHERSRYLLARDEGRLTGALVLNWLDEPATVRYRPGHFADLLGIDGRTLLAGATRGYRTTLLLAQPEAGDDQRAHQAREPGADGRGRTLGALLVGALSAASGDGCAGIVLPFLTTATLTELAGVVPVRAGFDLPEAELISAGLDLDTYTARASRRVRNKIRADRARFAGAGWTIRVRSLRECWRDAARLLYQLQRKHGHDEQTLAVYESRLADQARELGGRGVVFCCEDDEGMAGFALFYQWRSTFYGRSAGFDYDRLRGGNEYFVTTLCEPIDYAARHGMTVLHLGAGSWQAKGYRGAVMRPLWSAFIPADGADNDPGLDLVNAATAARWAADIADHGITIDAEEWLAPEKLAGVSGPS
jgi:uncharacterized protein